MNWLASRRFQFCPPSSERKSALFFDSIIAYTTCGFDGATARAILPYGFSGRPLLLLCVSSVQCSPLSVDLKRPLPGPPERKVQPCRRKSHMAAYMVFPSAALIDIIAHPLEPLAPASTLRQF